MFFFFFFWFFIIRTNQLYKFKKVQNFFKFMFKFTIAYLCHHFTTNEFIGIVFDNFYKLENLLDL